MQHDTEFDFESLPSGVRSAFRMTVDVVEECDLIDTVTMIAGDRSVRESVQSEIESHLTGGVLSIPVLAVRGTRPGKTLIATAGVHGDEYEGIEAIHRTIEALDPSAMSGTFVAVPVVTLPAHWMACRVNPLDSRNMAREILRRLTRPVACFDRECGEGEDLGQHCAVSRKALLALG